MRKTILLLTILFSATYSWAGKIDSLEQLLPTIKDDSIKVNVLIQLCERLHTTLPEKSLDYGKQALTLAEERGIYKELVSVYYRMAISCAQNGDYPNASQYFFKTKELATAQKDTTYLRHVLSSLTVMHGIREETKEAMKYLKEKLRLDSIQNNDPYPFDYDMLGNLYHLDYNTSAAIKAYKLGIKYAKAKNDSHALASIYCNMGITLAENNQLDSAKKYCQLALGIDKRFNRLHGMAAVYMQLGQIDFKQGYYKSASNNFNQSLKIGEKIASLELLEELYRHISENETALNNTTRAFDYYKKHITLRDSLNNDAMKIKLNNIASQHEIKLRDVQIAKNEAELKAQAAASQKKNLILIGAFIGLFLVILFSVLLFNRFRIIRQQKNTIEHQKHLVEEKNQEITDSIQYAKRIQSAILPPDKVVKEYLQQSFIFYKPKDIVAGDFYWLEHAKNKILFAAADCTGHGVPGAMVSVVCNNGLNRSVREHGLTDPGKILDKTREIVVQEFEKSEEEVKDGMDIALCSLEGNTLHYAGAHNPLWIIRKGADQIEEIKADKQPIGQTDNPTPYTTHKVELNEGDTFYIFSDGYADQFGGEKGKKLKSANFKKLLLSLVKEDMQSQLALLDDAFEGWKGDLEQLDDVCVIGVRV